MELILQIRRQIKAFFSPSLPILIAFCFFFPSPSHWGMCLIEIQRIVSKKKRSKKPRFYNFFFPFPPLFFLSLSFSSTLPLFQAIRVMHSCKRKKNLTNRFGSSFLFWTQDFFYLDAPFFRTLSLHRAAANFPWISFEYSHEALFAEIAVWSGTRSSSPWSTRSKLRANRGGN